MLSCAKLLQIGSHVFVVPSSRGLLCFHFALRKGWEETVKPLRKSLRAPASGQDETHQAAKERQAFDQLFSVAYEELRRLAWSVKRGERSNTLSPTAMVNEAWLKLAKSPGVADTSPLHFKRIAARAMRQLLVETARRRNAHKRGGDGEVIFVSFDDSRDSAPTCPENLLALDTALTELARLALRQALVVESRFFGGLEIGEISLLIGVSEATILRDWRAAKAWLGPSKLSPIPI